MYNPSLYPAIAISKRMYVGQGEFVVGEKECSKQIQHSSQFGYHIIGADKKPTTIDGLGEETPKSPTARAHDFLFLALCRVIPKIKHNMGSIPFLPMRCPQTGKSVFIFCKTCYTKKREELCICSEDERSWYGTYTLCELSHAVSLGYDVVILEAFYMKEQSDAFQLYFKALSSFKLANEVVVKNPDGSFNQKFYDDLNFKMGFEGGLKLTEKKCIENPSLRSFYKDQMNTGDVT